MFEKRCGSGYRPALDGIERKTLVHGEKTLMTEFRLRKGAVLPRHSHPHEQAGYLVKGRIRLSIGTEEQEAQVGDSWCIPGGDRYMQIPLPLLKSYERTLCLAWNPRLLRLRPELEKMKASLVTSLAEQ